MNLNEDSLEHQGRPPEPDQTVLFELYHENSKQRAHDLAFAQRIYAINRSPAVHEVVARAFKSYPGALPTALPAVALATPFERTVAERRSIRRFTGAPLSLDQVARLAYLANGLTGRLDAVADEPPQPVRAAPSGGALYPVELYVFAESVDELAPGLYHYAVDRHALELLRPGRWSSRMGELTSDPATFEHAAATFVLTGVFARSQFKYDERSYRFTLLEAGHICQNLLLTATALGLGAVPVGGFLDDGVHELMDLDGVDEAAIYLVAAGAPAPHPRPGADWEDPESLMGRILDSLTPDNAPGDDGG